MTYRTTPGKMVKRRASNQERADFGKSIGLRQASILEYLWLHGAQSVAQLHRGISKSDEVAYTTIFTELSRMLKKGLVAKNKDAESHLDVRYSAAVTRETLVSSLVARTLGSLIGAHGAAAVHGFVDAVADDPDALAALRSALEVKTRKKR